MAEQRARSAIGADRHGDRRWHSALRQVHQEIDQIDFALRALRQPAELGELLGEPLEPLGLGGKYVHGRGRLAVRLTATSPELTYPDAHRGERILDFVRHATGDLPERA